jgi:hypothetical protein
MRSTMMVAAALMTLAAGCAVRPAPETAPARSADLAAMNGDWVGEYIDGNSGKYGSITLNIRSSTDAASGEIILTPYGSSPVVAANVAARGHSTSPQVLRVAFRRAIGGLVEGTIEDYFSMDCSCVVTTVLQGTPTRNRIAGEYVTSNASGLRKQGRWSVERQVIAADDMRH